MTPAAAPRAIPPVRRPLSWALALILALAAALRWLRLDGSSLWSDEGNSWAMLRRDFGAIAAAAAQDIHPPGYYWLLKVWCLAAGGDAWGMRSLSALCGVVLVGVVYRVGLLLDRDSRHAERRIALVAALLAAVNPFLIHYSQEARMYSLLALESGLLFLAAALLVRGDPLDRGPLGIRQAIGIGPALLFSLSAAAGLWTHYSFPIVLAAADLFLLLALQRRISGGRAGAWPSVVAKLLVLNLPAVLLFAPWLPTAWRAVSRWPAGGRRPPLAEALPLLGRSFAFGPLGPAPLALVETNLGLSGAAALWLVRALLLAALLLPLLGLWKLRRSTGGAALALWLGAPLGLMFGLGLFGDAFLKFLLTAAPAWCLAVAAATLAGPAGGVQASQASGGRMEKGEAGQVPSAGASWSTLRRALRGWLPLVSLGLVVVAGLLPAAAALPSYYRPPGPRDDYAGVARELAATGNPGRDLVLLCAPGQAEVWAYYDPGLPVLALPAERPPDAARTVAALERTIRGRRQLTALWWAAADADPDGVIAGWLATHAFAGPTRWAGNVQVAQYGLAETLDCSAPPDGGADFSDGIRLEAVCFPRGEQPTPGRLLLAELRWRALARPSAAYAVSVQLLRPTVSLGASDAPAGTEVPVTLVAQQDGQPVGGTKPTDGWAAGEAVADRRAIALPPDAAPGDYLLRVALYDPVDGRRLAAGDRDHVDLPVRVVSGARAGTDPSRPRR